MTFQPIKPGDRFFSVTSNRRPTQGWVTVTKVGRRWAQFRNDGWTFVRPEDRFDIETLQIDAARFSSPGRVYRTEEEYRSGVRLHRLWQELRRAVDHQHRLPDGVTDLDILRAADALKIRLKEE